MNFDFKLNPTVDKLVQEKKALNDKKEEEERNKIAELQKQKALRNEMQSTVLTQLASKQPSNPNANINATPSIDTKQGW